MKNTQTLLLLFVLGFTAFGCNKLESEIPSIRVGRFEVMAYDLVNPNNGSTLFTFEEIESGNVCPTGWRVMGEETALKIEDKGKVEAVFGNETHTYYGKLYFEDGAGRPYEYIVSYFSLSGNSIHFPSNLDNARQSQNDNRGRALEHRVRCVKN